MDTAAMFMNMAAVSMDAAQQEMEASDVWVREHRWKLRWVLDQMKPRTRSILERRYAGRTLQEIADEEGLSKERVRQLQVKAEKEMEALLPMVPEWPDAEKDRTPGRIRGSWSEAE
jgi:DNA-directed RNA polymerase sigma subunit (sigma70/sigma32)